MLRKHIELAIRLEAIFKIYKPNSLIFTNCFTLNWIIASKGQIVLIKKHTLPTDSPHKEEMEKALKDFMTFCEFTSVLAIVTSSTKNIKQIKEYEVSRSSTYRRISLNPYLQEGLTSRWTDVFENLRTIEYRLRQ